MSVTCERPLDGASAAQKLNSHSFDLVLVDCENLPAAKLIFDVCRRGKNGNNPVPIAIVDGRAGLPTAFRLGAELILTKPVAKDQARSTIRTAVSRVRKDVPANESMPAQPASPALPSAVTTSALAPSTVMPAPSRLKNTLWQPPLRPNRPALRITLHPLFQPSLQRWLQPQLSPRRPSPRRCIPPWTKTKTKTKLMPNQLLQSWIRRPHLLWRHRHLY